MEALILLRSALRARSRRVRFHRLRRAVPALVPLMSAWWWWYPGALWYGLWFVLIAIAWAYLPPLGFNAGYRVACAWERAMGWRNDPLSGPYMLAQGRDGAAWMRERALALAVVRAQDARHFEDLRAGPSWWIAFSAGLLVALCLQALPTPAPPFPAPRFVGIDSGFVVPAGESLQLLLEAPGAQRVMVRTQSGTLFPVNSLGADGRSTFRLERVSSALALRLEANTGISPWLAIQVREPPILAWERVLQSPPYVGRQERWEAGILEALAGSSLQVVLRSSEALQAAQLRDEQGTRYSLEQLDGNWQVTIPLRRSAVLTPSVVDRNGDTLALPTWQVHVREDAAPSLQVPHIPLLVDAHTALGADPMVCSDDEGLDALRWEVRAPQLLLSGQKALSGTRQELPWWLGRYDLGLEVAASQQLQMRLRDLGGAQSEATVKLVGLDTQQAQFLRIMLECDATLTTINQALERLESLYRPWQRLRDGWISNDPLLVQATLRQLSASAEAAWSSIGLLREQDLDPEEVLRVERWNESVLLERAWWSDPPLIGARAEVGQAMLLHLDASIGTLRNLRRNLQGRQRAAALNHGAWLLALGEQWEQQERDHALALAWWRQDRNPGLALQAWPGRKEDRQEATCFRGLFTGNLDLRQLPEWARSEPFFATLEGEIFIPDQEAYNLTVEVDDGVQLWFANIPRLSDAAWGLQPATRYSVRIEGAQGWQPLRMEYWQGPGGARLRLSLTPVAAGADAWNDVTQGQLRSLVVSSEQPALESLLHENAISANDLVPLLQRLSVTGEGSAVVRDLHQGSTSWGAALTLWQSLKDNRWQELSPQAAWPARFKALGQQWAQGGVFGQRSGQLWRRLVELALGQLASELSEDEADLLMALDTLWQGLKEVQPGEADEIGNRLTGLAEVHRARRAQGLAQLERLANAWKQAGQEHLAQQEFLAHAQQSRALELAALRWQGPGRPPRELRWPNMRDLQQRVGVFAAAQEPNALQLRILLQLCTAVRRWYAPGRGQELLDQIARSLRHNGWWRVPSQRQFLELQISQLAQQQALADPLPGALPLAAAAASREVQRQVETSEEDADREALFPVIVERAGEVVERMMPREYERISAASGPWQLERELDRILSQAGNALEAGQPEDNLQNLSQLHSLLVELRQLQRREVWLLREAAQRASIPARVVPLSAWSLPSRQQDAEFALNRLLTVLLSPEDDSVVLLAAQSALTLVQAWLEEQPPLDIRQATLADRVLAALKRRLPALLQRLQQEPALLSLEQWPLSRSALSQRWALAQSLLRKDEVLALLVSLRAYQAPEAWEVLGTEVNREVPTMLRDGEDARTIASSAEADLAPWPEAWRERIRTYFRLLAAEQP